MSPVGDCARLEVAISGKSYRTQAGDRRAALGAIAFKLHEGELAALVGPSGCGKTTLLRIVAGLDRDFEGSVTRRPGDRLGVAFQEPRLLPWRSVEFNIRVAAPEARDREFDALFERFGLSAHRDDFPGELSLGLARRAALVRALAVDPDLLLLDEPFASLDAATRGDMVATLGEFLRPRETASLMITHDLDAAARLADVVFVLSEPPARISREIRIAEPRSERTPDTVVAALRRLGAMQRSESV